MSDLADLKLADLWETCPACRGADETLPPPEPTKSSHELVQQFHRPAECRVCQGAKGKPTAAGDALLKFLRLAGR